MSSGHRNGNCGIANGLIGILQSDGSAPHRCHAESNMPDTLAGGKGNQYEDANPPGRVDLLLVSGSRVMLLEKKGFNQVACLPCVRV